MGRFRLEINLTLFDDNRPQNQPIYDNLKIDGLTFFQVCFILGGLQVLANEAKEGTE